jgi:hypothetical protein
LTDTEGGGWVRGRCYHAHTLLGAGEVKLIFCALRWKEKENIQIQYLIIAFK